MVSAISAFPPSRFRETAMFAMFTPASPKSVPTRPITPGTSSYRSSDHARCELHLELEAERRDEPVAVVVADRRAGDAAPSAETATRFVKSREERRFSSTTSIAAVGGDHGRVDVVHRLVASGPGRRRSARRR